MKHLFFAAGMLVALGIAPAVAQNRAGLPVAQVLVAKPMEEGVDRDLQEYVAIAKKNSPEALDKLMGIAERGLARSTANANLLVNIIDMQVPVEHKAAAIALLASLFEFESSSSLNWQITQQLRTLAMSSEMAISNAALLRYSRLGYFSDTHALLQFNLDRKFISLQDMLGELAHLLIFAPAAEQLRLIGTFTASRNRYAIDIVISNLKSPENRQRLSSDAKLAMFRLLEQEPKFFSSAPREFDVMEAIEYSNWLHSFAALSHDLGRATYLNVVVANLVPENVDPRKAIAFFLSQEGKSAASRIPKTQLQSIIAKITAYQSGQHPGDGTREWSSNVIGYLGSFH